VKSQLLNEGHKSIPKNVVRLYEVLNDHELIIRNPQGDSIWVAEVNDLGRNWQQKLTFLRFENQVLWPTSTPEEFDGTITPVDKEGNPLESLPLIAKKAEPEERPPKEVSNKTVVAKTHNQVASGDSKDVISSNEASQQWEKGEIQSELHLRKNDFIDWLLDGIERRKIRVNEPKAPVHILSDHVALVTPAIFVEYLDKNSLKKNIYASRAEGKKPYTVLQRELESLGINQKSRGGQNILTMHVEGQRKQGRLKVYLLDRKSFPSLNRFSANTAMKIEL